MKKLLGVVLILICAACVVLIYAGRGARDALKESIEGKLPAGDAVKKITFSSRPKDGDSVSGGDKSVRIAKADAVAGRRKADTKAREFIAGAKSFLKFGDPGRAKTELDAVKNLWCSTALKKEARELVEKEVSLYENVFAVDPDPEDFLKIYEMRGGGMVRGWVVNRDDDTVTLKIESGGETILNEADIGHVTLVKEEERREEIMNQYAARKNSIVDADALAHYDLAVFCRKKGMDDLVIEHLETALRIDSDVYKAVGDKGAKKLYLMAVWFGSMGKKDKAGEYERKLREKFPSSKYITMIEEEAARIIEEKAIAKQREEQRKKEAAAIAALDKELRGYKTSGNKTSTKETSAKKTTTASSWEAKGDEFYEEGLEHSRKSMPFMATREFSKENKLALKAFESALKSYRKAKKDGSATARIEDKIVAVNSMKYGCLKMSRVE